MDSFLPFFLSYLVVGHVTVWAALWNRLHGLGLSFGVCSRMTALLVAIGAVLPTTLVSLIAHGDLPVFFSTQSDVERSQVGLLGAALANIYLGICCLALPFALGWRIWKKLSPLPAVVLSKKHELLFDLTSSRRREPGLRARARSGVLHLLKVVRRKKIESRKRRGTQSFDHREIATTRLKSSRHTGKCEWGSAGITAPSQDALGIGNDFGTNGMTGRAGRVDLRKAGEPDRRALPLFENSSRVESPNEPKVGCHIRQRAGTFLLRFPGNESLSCYRESLALVLNDLPLSLNGVKIVQLSDLHFIGRIPNEFYSRVVDKANEEQADFIFITGDIVDSPKWIEQAQRILSGLQARQGVYFILGNHDVRAGAERVRASLRELGFHDVGGRVHETVLRGSPIIIGGNELPWFGPAPRFPPKPSDGTVRPQRWLLAHTPDQIFWAVRNGIDLMLAGHTHGGQACLPWLGPIIAPSGYGIRFAQGVFHRPPTVMYVSRGVGGEFPIRYFCPPELTCLQLFAPAGTD